MRRGPNAYSPTDPDDGWSKQELLDAVGATARLEGEIGRRETSSSGSGLSPKTFDAIRKVARVKGPSHGGNSWVFNAEEVKALIRTAEGGRFTERGGPIGAAWRALLLERGIEVEGKMSKRRK